MTIPVIVQGTLQPDGTLKLDQAITLPPGPVLVTVQPSTSSGPSVRGLADVIDEIRIGQRARGYSGRNAEDIDAVRKEGEAEYEQRMQVVHAPVAPGPAAGQS